MKNKTFRSLILPNLKVHTTRMPVRKKGAKRRLKSTVGK